MLLTKIRPPMVALFYLALAFGINLFIKSPMSFNYNHRMLGVATMITGLVVMLWAWGLFKRNQTPLRPSELPKVIVKNGPFEFSRNPMYLGIVLILAGIACWMGSLIMFVAPGAFFITINSIYIPHEEHLMEYAFQEEYHSYKESVRRWL